MKISRSGSPSSVKEEFGQCSGCCNCLAKDSKKNVPNITYNAQPFFVERLCRCRRAILELPNDKTDSCVATMLG